MINNINESAFMKDIPEYEGHYAATSDGRIWSYKSKKFLKTRTHKGYLKVNLHKNGDKKTYLVHRLIAFAFLPNPNNLSQINHIDECKTNNRVENLEWCDAAYNVNYGTRNKRTSKKVFCVELNKEFESMSEAARHLNLDQGSISRCCNGKQKTCGGYHWEYIDGGK